MGQLRVSRVMLHEKRRKTGNQTGNSLERRPGFPSLEPGFAYKVGVAESSVPRTPIL